MNKRIKQGLWLLLCVFAVSVFFAPQVRAAAKSSSDLCTVKFYEENGSSVIAQKKVKKGNAVMFPAIPEKKGYENLGWSLIKGKNSAGKKAGTSIKVTKSMNYYAVRRKKPYTLTYYTNTGKKIKTVEVSSGQIKLPTRRNPAGYTFLGWSTKAKQSSDPKYRAGQTITLTGDRKLYEVLFDRKKEPDVNLSDIDISQKYSKIIFVGDSRTYYMELVLKRLCGEKNMKNVQFVSQPGVGISWFRQQGYSKLLDKIGNAKNKKPVAVIFNYGVNDIRHKDGMAVDCKAVAKEYINYWNTIESGLKAKNCKLFYMSINPINSIMTKTSGLRKEAELLYLNQCIKSGLKGYTYIDTYSWLIRNGYSSDVGKNGMETGIDDGTHYGDLTYKRIYKYCLKAIMR